MRRPSGGPTVRFDLVYEDGTRDAAREMPANLLSGADDDARAHRYFNDLELYAARRSGLPPRRIKALARSKQ